MPSIAFPAFSEKVSVIGQKSPVRARFRAGVPLLEAGPQHRGCAWRCPGFRLGPCVAAGGRSRRTQIRMRGLGAIIPARFSPGFGRVAWRKACRSDSPAKGESALERADDAAAHARSGGAWAGRPRSPDGEKAPALLCLLRARRPGSSLLSLFFNLLVMWQPSTATAVGFGLADSATS